MIPSIYTRRSTRSFRTDPIPEEALKDILSAGMQAPSPKNRQPWKFVVVSGAAKAGMLLAMARGIDRSAEGNGLISPQISYAGDDAFNQRAAGEAGASIPENVFKGYIGDARYTLRIMEEAPVTVFVVNPYGRSPRTSWTASDKLNELSNVQSIGAAAENMALTAASLGIGSLWNGNIFFAYDELTEWLDVPGEMVLAMSFGYPKEQSTRTVPRKSWDDCVIVKTGDGQ